MATLPYNDGRGLGGTDIALLNTTVDPDYKDKAVSMVNCPACEACDEIGNGNYTVTITDFPIFGVPPLGNCDVDTYDINGAHLLPKDVGFCTWNWWSGLWRCTAATFVGAAIRLECTTFKLAGDDTPSYRGWYVKIGWAAGVGGGLGNSWAAFGQFEPFNPMRKPRVQVYPFVYLGSLRDVAGVSDATVEITDYVGVL